MRYVDIHGAAPTPNTCSKAGGGGCSGVGPGTSGNAGVNAYNRSFTFKSKNDDNSNSDGLNASDDTAESIDEPTRISERILEVIAQIGQALLSMLGEDGKLTAPVSGSGTAASGALGPALGALNVAAKAETLNTINLGTFRKNVDLCGAAGKCNMPEDLIEVTRLYNQKDINGIEALFRQREWDIQSPAQLVNGLRKNDE